MTEKNLGIPLRRSFLLWSISLGLAGGLLEVAILAVRKLWFEENLLLSPQFVWMTPVVNAIFALGVGVFLVCILPVLPTKVAAPIAFFSLAVVSFLSPMLAIPRLHPAAALVLAMGLGTQASRFLSARTGAGLDGGGRTLGWIAAILICLALGMNAWRILETRQAIAALPQAPANAPNVLLIVMDTVRAQSLSLYGYGKRTSPELERLAKTGVVFDAALSTAPWTLPSHASLFTGRWPHELNVDWTTGLDRTFPTLAEVLEARGYVTAGFAANLIYASSAHGLDRGFAYYKDFPVSGGQAIVSSSLATMISTKNRVRNWFNNHRVLNRKTAAEVNDEFLGWLSHQEHQPFFAFLNYMDAHEPYLPPKPFEGQFGPPREQAIFEYSATDAFRPSKWAMSPAQVTSEVAEYDGAVAYLDHELEQLVDELTKRGLLENTLLIVTSDHGEHLGEHRLFGHGNSLYRTVLEVPLLLSFPNHVPAGTVVGEPVSLRDVPSTVLDLIGAKASLPGVSLSRYWKEGTKTPESSNIVISEASKRVFGAQKPWYPLTKGNMKSVVTAGYHYIVNDNGEEELYDFKSDPDELRDLAGSDQGKQIARRIKDSLDAELKK